MCFIHAKLIYVCYGNVQALLVNFYMNGGNLMPSKNKLNRFMGGERIIDSIDE